MWLASGIGAVLFQEGKPIPFWSRKMVLAKESYHITEQEHLAAAAAREALKAF